MLNAEQHQRTSIYQSYCVFAVLFSKKIATTQNIASTEIDYQFLGTVIYYRGRGGWAGANGVGVIPFCAPENGGLHKIVQPFRLNLTRYLCSEYNGHDWLQTCRYKIREFWGLFAKIRDKSVVEFPSYWHFLSKNAVLIICRYIES